MTTKEVAGAIRANVDRWQTRTITFEQFDAEQRRLWDYAHGRSERFSDAVARMIMPPMSMAALGALGGKAGAGASKRRGDSAYYKALRAKVKMYKATLRGKTVRVTIPED